MIDTESHTAIKPMPIELTRKLLSKYLIDEWLFKYYEDIKQHNRAQKLIMGFYQERPRIMTGDIAKAPDSLRLKYEFVNPKISTNDKKSQGLSTVKELIKTYVLTLNDDEVIGLTYLVIDRLTPEEKYLAEQLRLWLVSNYFHFIYADTNGDYARDIADYIAKNKQLTQDFIVYWLGAIDTFKDYCAENQDNMKLILDPFCFIHIATYNKKLLLILINQIIQLNINKYPNYVNNNLLCVLKQLDDNANIIPLPVSYLRGYLTSICHFPYKPFTNGITFKFYHKRDLGDFVNAISADYCSDTVNKALENIHFDLNNQKDKIEGIRKHFEEVFQMTGSNCIKHVLEYFKLLIK